MRFHRRSGGFLVGGAGLAVIVVCLGGLVLYTLTGPLAGWMLRYLAILVPYFALLAARGIQSIPRRLRLLRWVLLVGAIGRSCKA